MSPSATAHRSPSPRRTLAEQLAPVVRLHERIRDRRYAQADVETARARIIAGRHGIDARTLLTEADDLAPAFWRMASALERTGVASSACVVAFKERAIDPRILVLAWANRESPPRDATMQFGRQVASLVGNAVLSRAASDVADGISLSHWKRISCPCCGATPELVVIADDRRTLVCWRCDARWQTESTGCLGCRADEPPEWVRVQSSHLGYELAICNACGRYLKERRGALTQPLLVERALVAGLDEAAQQRGLRT